MADIRLIPLDHVTIRLYKSICIFCRSSSKQLEEIEDRLAEASKLLTSNDCIEDSKDKAKEPTVPKWVQCSPKEHFYSSNAREQIVSEFLQTYCVNLGISDGVSAS